MGGWMIMPGCRSKGFNPWPSAGVNKLAPDGRKMASTISPEGSSHSRLKGFSKKITRSKKKPRVVSMTVVTQGSNSRSRDQLRSEIAVAKIDISHDQNTSEPGCPPHKAVTLR